MWWWLLLDSAVMWEVVCGVCWCLVAVSGGIVDQQQIVFGSGIDSVDRNSKIYRRHTPNGTSQAVNSKTAGRLSGLAARDAKNLTVFAYREALCISVEFAVIVAKPGNHREFQLRVDAP